MNMTYVLNKLINYKVHHCRVKCSFIKISNIRWICSLYLDLALHPSYVVYLQSKAFDLFHYKLDYIIYIKKLVNMKCKNRISISCPMPMSWIPFGFSQNIYCTQIQKTINTNFKTSPKPHHKNSKLPNLNPKCITTKKTHIKPHNAYNKTLNKLTQMKPTQHQKPKYPNQTKEF